MALFHSALVSALSSNSLIAALRKPYPLFKSRAALQTPTSAAVESNSSRSAAISHSLRLLEWDKVCDLVSSFAGTQLGREKAKAQLWSTTDLCYEESRMRLAETTAAIELINYGGRGMDFAGIDIVLVKSAIVQASKGFPITGLEAIAVMSLLEFAENLQATVEDAVKKDADWYRRFMPLAEVIMNVSICQSLVAAVKKIIDEDGSVRDSASSELKRCRDQVFILERKLYHLMDKLARNKRSESSSSEVCNISGRWCIKFMSNKLEDFDGLLLSSGSVTGYVIEPIAAIELNDELQQARTLVSKVEEDVLSQLTDKMLAELDSINIVFNMMIQLDAVAARAKYSIEYGGAYPNIFMPGEMNSSLTVEGDSCLNDTLSKAFIPHLLKKWKLYMPKAHHPLLLKQYRTNLENARKGLSNVASDLRRKKMQGKTMSTDDIDSYLDSMKQSVLRIERSPPIPVDFAISTNTTVLVITGPNAGGKTVNLKTVGIASLMSKAGLYVLASEPVEVPWFDAVYADIGDEQSLTQSLSTFSGHLKQISAIISNSTSNSLVLLDEVGAGTNPLEGAALGMSILENFSENISLTIATTHHGELKTLKYSNRGFENACVEFNEENLQPTYRILWGIPGRSNAINIAEKMGLPYDILSMARELHGKASAEINEIIIDLENSKQDFEQCLQEAQYNLLLAKNLHRDLLTARQRVAEHCDIQATKKEKSLSEFAATARSILRTRLQKHRESPVARRTLDISAADNSEEHQQQNIKLMHSVSAEERKVPDMGRSSRERLVRVPEVGETVFVPSICKEAAVLEVLASKGEIVVQANSIRLRLKLKDIAASV